MNLQTTDKRKQKTSHFYSFEPRPASEFDKRGKYIRLLPPQANVGMSKSTAEQAAATLVSIPSRTSWRCGISAQNSAVVTTTRLGISASLVAASMLRRRRIGKGMRSGRVLWVGVFGQV